jgi:hypothetical protein
MLNPSPVPCPTCFVVKKWLAGFIPELFCHSRAAVHHGISASVPKVFTSTHFSGNGSTASAALFNRCNSTYEITGGRQSIGSNGSAEPFHAFASVRSAFCCSSAAV